MPDASNDPPLDTIEKLYLARLPGTVERKMVWDLLDNLRSDIIKGNCDAWEAHQLADAISKLDRAGREIHLEATKKGRLAAIPLGFIGANALGAIAKIPNGGAFFALAVVAMIPAVLLAMSYYEREQVAKRYDAESQELQKRIGGIIQANESKRQAAEAKAEEARQAAEAKAEEARQAAEATQAFRDFVDSTKWPHGHIVHRNGDALLVWDKFKKVQVATNRVGEPVYAIGGLVSPDQLTPPPEENSPPTRVRVDASNGAASGDNDEKEAQTPDPPKREERKT